MWKRDGLARSSSRPNYPFRNLLSDLNFYSSTKPKRSKRTLTHVDQGFPRVIIDRLVCPASPPLAPRSGRKFSIRVLTGGLIEDHGVRPSLLKRWSIPHELTSNLPPFLPGRLPQQPLRPQASRSVPAQLCLPHQLPQRTNRSGPKPPCPAGYPAVATYIHAHEILVIR